MKLLWRYHAFIINYYVDKFEYYLSIPTKTMYDSMTSISFSVFQNVEHFFEKVDESDCLES